MPISFTGPFAHFCAWLAVGWVSTMRRSDRARAPSGHEELEATVAERTASLRRSEAICGSTEAKPLRCDGLQGLEVFYGSEEIYRIWGFDPAPGVSKTAKAVLHGFTGRP